MIVASTIVIVDGLDVPDEPDTKSPSGAGGGVGADTAGVAVGVGTSGVGVGVGARVGADVGELVDVIKPLGIRQLVDSSLKRAHFWPALQLPRKPRIELDIIT